MDRRASPVSLKPSPRAHIQLASKGLSHPAPANKQRPRQRSRPQADSGRFRFPGLWLDQEANDHFAGPAGFNA